MKSKSEYGQKVGKQKGLKKGGRRQNQTSKCRNPTVKRKR